jgi:aspartyl protease family protein
MPSHHDDSSIRRTAAWMTIIGWIVFFLLLFYLFNRVWENMQNPNTAVATQYIGERKQVTLQRNKYGHYVATGAINGEPVVFLVDTGATDIAIPESIANKLGLEKGPAMTARTANGIATAYATRLDSVSLGEITLHDIRGSILANAGTEEILLGMTFLKHLELNQKGDELTIIQ